MSPRPLIAAAAAALLLAPAASARPDGPLRPFFEHQAELAGLIWPANGVVTDGFGTRGGAHDGVDIGMLRSLDVVAAHPGLVTAAGFLPGYEGYGTVVILDATDGTSTLYAHLARADVSVGQWVPVGAHVGLAGCTGSCTGTHLHFELRERGRPVDPLPSLLRGAATEP